MLIVIFFISWVVTPSFFNGTYKLIEESVDPIVTSELKQKAAYSSSILATTSTAAVSFLIGTGGLSSRDKTAGACRSEISHLVLG